MSGTPDGTLPLLSSGGRLARSEVADSATEDAARSATDATQLPALPAEFIESRPAASSPWGSSGKDPRLGTTLQGKYRIERMIGEGGCGRVYAATHLQLKHQVAIKFLLAQWAGRPVFRERFRREARALSLLSHPGIVVVHDFGEDGGDLFLVMEYVQGTPLSQLVLVQGKAMEPLRAVQLIDQLLLVLEVAHERGIVHRDLKPANVLVCRPAAGSASRMDMVAGALPARLPSESIKVLDFGMASVEEAGSGERLTETGTIFGTLHYMSPEHCRGRGIGPPSDIYSVGIIFYELLSGAVPFDGHSPVDMMTHHLFVTPPAMDQVGVRRTVAPELAALAMWALAKKPEKRPTATQFREALRSALAKTDPVSEKRQLNDERIAVTGLPRIERALTKLPVHVATAPSMPSDAEDVNQPLMLLWGFDEEGAAQLQGALMVHHIQARRWPPGELPPPAIEGQSVRGLLLPDGPRSAEKVAALRRSNIVGKLPLMVVQVNQAQAIPVLIRAGASDVSLASTDTGDICRKVWRMIRSKR